MIKYLLFKKNLIKINQDLLKFYEIYNLSSKQQNNNFELSLNLTLSIINSNQHIS